MSDGTGAMLWHSECVKCQRALEAAEARCALLEKALGRIMDLKAGGPHISAEDGFSAALCSLDRARDIALAALQQETGDGD